MSLFPRCNYSWSEYFYITTLKLIFLKQFPVILFRSWEITSQFEMYVYYLANSGLISFKINENLEYHNDTIFFFREPCLNVEYPLESVSKYSTHKLHIPVKSGCFRQQLRVCVSQFCIHRA